MDSSLSHSPRKSGKVIVQRITKVDDVRVGLESEEVSLPLVTPYEIELCRSPPSVIDSEWDDARNPRTVGHGGIAHDESIASGPQGPNDTASLASDTEDYLDIYGRSFPNPNYGWNWCAVDEKFELTSERDYFFHHRRQDFRLFRAPVPEPTHVFDLKACFGSWADAVAAAYETVDVLGIDNAPVQYATESNCRFEIDDINQKWDRELEYFDLVYGNKLLGNVDNCLGCSVAQQTRELGDLVGCSFVITRDTYKNYMAEAGFLDIHEIWEETPVADCLDIVLDEIECFLFRKWQLEGVEPEEAERYIVTLRSQLESEASEVYTHSFILTLLPGHGYIGDSVTAWGRKPFTGEITSVSNGSDSDGGVNDVEEPTGETRRDMTSSVGSSKRRHGDVSTSAGFEGRGIDQYGPRDAKRFKREQLGSVS